LTKVDWSDGHDALYRDFIPEHAVGIFSGKLGRNVSRECWLLIAFFRKDTTAVVGAFGLSINSPSSVTDTSVEEVVDPEDPFIEERLPSTSSFFLTHDARHPVNYDRHMHKFELVSVLHFKELREIFIFRFR
jgi:hypothetical protein